ncbi:hypothetical protein Bpla01_38000 [Burkholderia plantarii]|nr:hypothetical protein Bpla01_38000 [Burkholderia plantarii]
MAIRGAAAIGGGLGAHPVQARGKSARAIRRIGSAPPPAHETHASQTISSIPREATARRTALSGMRSVTR